MPNVPHSAPHGYSPNVPLLRAPVIAGLIPACVPERPEPITFSYESVSFNAISASTRRKLFNATEKLLEKAVYALAKGTSTDLIGAAFDFDASLSKLCQEAPVIITSVMEKTYGRGGAALRIPTKEEMNAEIDEMFDKMIDGMAERYAAFMAKRKPASKPESGDNHVA